MRAFLVLCSVLALWVGCSTAAPRAAAPSSRPTCGVFGVECRGGGCCDEGSECCRDDKCCYVGTDGSLQPLGRKGIGR
jgi:hypothetical protein